MKHRVSESEYLKRFEKAALLAPEFFGHTFSGKGCVICGGGGKYFPCAWVAIRMLRQLGFTFPIELWHLGEGEMSEEMKALLLPFNVSTIDAFKFRAKFPVPQLNGWELKAYALLHSSFSGILLLDADNVPVVDPSFLFDTPEYKKTGAVFWPDFGRLHCTRPIWHICGVRYRDEPEFESGQIVVNKEKSWHALNVAMHLNEYSDYYYNFIHGDKDTFHMAWRKLGQEYSMPNFPIHALHATMCQHDFAGRRIFQHRNLEKWKLWGDNPRIPGFLYEEECLGFLDELRSVWRGSPPGISRFTPDGRLLQEIAIADELTASKWLYRRLGHDERPMSFLPNGYVGTGSAGCEIFWDVSIQDGTSRLEVSGGDARTFFATKTERGTWVGKWERFERMGVEISRLPQKIYN